MSFGIIHALSAIAIVLLGVLLADNVLKLKNPARWIVIVAFAKP